MKKGILLISLLIITAPQAFTQNLEWVKAWGGTSEDFTVKKILVDAEGNSYNAGVFQGTIDFDPGPETFEMTYLGYYDPYITKFDSDGNFLWGIKWGGEDYVNITGICRDSDGRFIVTGFFEGTADFDPGIETFNLESNGNVNTYLCVLDSDGNFIRAQSWGSEVVTGSYDLTLDDADNIIILGFFDESADFDPGEGTFELTSTGQNDIYIMKLDSEGNLLWARNFGGTKDDEGKSVDVDSSGNVYISGSFMDTADFDPGGGEYMMTAMDYPDTFISKLDSDGNFIWTKQWRKSSSFFDFKIRLNEIGELYVYGSFNDSLDVDPGPNTFNIITNDGSSSFISVLDSDGNFIRASQWGGPLHSKYTDITFDQYGNLFGVGTFVGNADFNPGSGSHELTSNGFSDVYLNILDPEGNFIYATSWGGTSSDGVKCITRGLEQNFYIGGTYSDTVDFDPGSGISELISNGESDIFVSKINLSGLVGVNNPSESSFNVYPNPTGGNITIDLGENQKGRLEIFNSLGQKLAEKKIGNTSEEINLSGAPGIYFVKIKKENSVRVIKVVKQ